MEQRADKVFFRVVGGFNASANQQLKGNFNGIFTFTSVSSYTKSCSKFSVGNLK
jgi:hypothetical protein